MVDISWKGAVFTALVKKNAMDGLEEWCQGTWLPQATKDCPVDSGVMKGSLGVERNDAGQFCLVGGGGEASSYIARQELDRSLKHPVGKAGFIQDSVNMHKSKLVPMIEKRIN